MEFTNCFKRGGRVRPHGFRLDHEDVLPGKESIILLKTGGVKASFHVGVGANFTPIPFGFGGPPFFLL
jgi:hypothetical protein